MDIQIKLLLEQIQNLKYIVEILEKRIEELEDINSEYYCYFCKHKYHKLIFKCNNCEKNICEYCAVERNAEYFCKRKCCLDKRS